MATRPYAAHSAHFCRFDRLEDPITRSRIAKPLLLRRDGVVLRHTARLGLSAGPSQSRGAHAQLRQACRTRAVYKPAPFTLFFYIDYRQVSASRSLSHQHSSPTPHILLKMLSFSTLSVFAALALSTFTSAAPALPGVSDVTSAVPGLSAVSGLTGSLPVVNGLLPRDTKNVVTIINETQYKVTEYTVEFHYITAQNATIEVLAPLVENIKGVLGDALVEINGLVGQSQTVILGVEGGALLAVGDVAAAIVGLLTLVLDAVSAVLAVVSSDATECVTYLLSGLVEVLGCLVCAIVMLVNGLLGNVVSTVVSLLGGVVGILSTLKVTVLISILGITV